MIEIMQALDVEFSTFRNGLGGGEDEGLSLLD